MSSAGWRLSGYRIESVLGAGATCEVWRATVRATGMAVALKRIRVTDPAQRDRAVSEAAVLRALDHPNLIRLHRVERVDGAIVLVLDLAAGGSLAALLGARGRLTPGEVVAAFAPIAGALAQAHAADVVHGDVTPANVLFSELGLPLLADLGVARLTGDPTPVHTTLPYADPVVMSGGLPEPSSDVFMLAGVTLHALTGHPPPSAAGALDPDAWAARIAAQCARAQAPPALAAVLVRALSLEPELRSTATQFALDLRCSARPVAVELTAGRTRVEPSLARLAAIAAGRPVPSDSARVPDAPPLTAGVRLPDPMVRPPKHRAGSRRRWRRLALPAATIAGAAGLITGVLALAPFGHNSSSAAAPAHVAAVSASLPSSPSAVSSSRLPAHTAERPLVPDLSTATAALTALDRARAAAFAARDPNLLARVYSSAALLARDQAMLASVVPPGCHLDGVRTRFARPRLVRATATQVEVQASAQLQPSQLRCAGRSAGTAPGSQGLDLDLTLVRADAGWRIAAEHPADG